MSRCLLDVEDDGSPAVRLAHLISEISEDTACAQWEGGIEFELWQLVVNPPDGPVPRLMGTIEVETSAKLREYSDLAGGWVAWDDNDCGGESGVRFVPLAEWLEMVEQHKRREPTWYERPKTEAERTADAVAKERGRLLEEIATALAPATLPGVLGATDAEILAHARRVVARLLGAPCDELPAYLQRDPRDDAYSLVARELSQLAHDEESDVTITFDHKTMLVTVEHKRGRWSSLYLRDTVDALLKLRRGAP